MRAIKQWVEFLLHRLSTKALVNKINSAIVKKAKQILTTEDYFTTRSSVSKGWKAFTLHATSGEAYKECNKGYHSLYEAMIAADESNSRDLVCKIADVMKSPKKYSRVNVTTDEDGVNSSVIIKIGEDDLFTDYSIIKVVYPTIKEVGKAPTWVHVLVSFATFPGDPYTEKFQSVPLSPWEIRYLARTIYVLSQNEVNDLIGYVEDKISRKQDF